MAFGYPGGTAVPAVKQSKTPIEAGKIKGRGQACGAGSDNGAIQRLDSIVFALASRRAASNDLAASGFDWLLPTLLTLIVRLRGHSMPFAGGGLLASLRQESAERLPVHLA